VGESATSPLAALDARIRDAESQLARQSQEVRDAADPAARQRDWIGKVIIAVFAGAICLGLLVLVLEGILAPSEGRAEAWKNVATQSADLIKSAVLPVVTLVLGYYFGQASRT
jgi:uncharacterized protein YjeT (DUF2065 family)